MAGNDSVNFSRFHRGFRNGDGSGAFFFALITPGWLNGYAVHASARRTDAAKISPERINSFREALTALALPVPHRHRQALVVAAQRANTNVRGQEIADCF